MINRPRTAFVSIAAVAVSMIVLGTDARAKSGPAASPQKYREVPREFGRTRNENW